MFLFWHQAPVVRIAIPFACGIVLGFNAPEWLSNLPFVLIASAICIIGILGRRSSWKIYKYRFLFGGLLTFVFLLFGAALSNARLGLRQFDQHFSGEALFYKAELTAYPMQSARTTRLELSISAYIDSLNRVNGMRANILAYLPFSFQADTLAPGDILIFAKKPSQVTSPLNPGQFDFGAYLINKGFLATVYLNEDVHFQRTDQSLIFSRFVLQRWREEAIDVFRNAGFKGRELGVVAALVLGKRELVDGELLNAYTDAGTVHILAVSGLHVGIIYLFVVFLLNKVLRGKRTRLFKFLVTLSALWIYAGITGFSPSVLRAATMFSFIALGKYHHRFGNIYNMLAASALVLLVVNPFLIREVGFQLSYLAVIGIVYLHPKIYPLLANGNYLWDKVWSLFVVSCTAQLATFPLSLYYFGQFPNYFWFTNLAVIPLATVILYAGIVALLLAWIPFLGTGLSKLLEWATWMLNEFILFSGNLPGSVSEGIVVAAPATVLIYAFIFSLILSFNDPRFGNLVRTGTLVLVLLGLFVKSTIKTQRQISTTVLHIDENSCVVSAIGDKAYVVADTGAYVREKLDYQLKSFLRTTRARHIEWIDLSENTEKPLFLKHGQILATAKSTVVILDEEVDLARLKFTKQIDVLLLTGKISLPDELEYDFVSEATAIVVDGSVPWYKRSEILEKLETAGFRPWNTALDGAYVAR